MTTSSNLMKTSSNLLQLRNVAVARNAIGMIIGKHYVLVTGNWLAGIWRYVEE